MSRLLDVSLLMMTLHRVKACGGDMNHFRLALFCVTILFLAWVNSGCVKGSRTLGPGVPINAPFGVDSLCENNPEECDE